MPHPALATVLCVTICLVTTSNTSAEFDPITVEYTLPTLDRWNYPFNQSPGSRPLASTFGTFEGDDFSEDFDNRGAQFHVAFDTAADIETGLGAGSYLVTEAIITVQIAVGNQFRYDPTYDVWQSYLPPNHPDYIPDTTTGRPIELYGVGFRYGHGPLTYQENTPFWPKSGLPIGKNLRATYALDFDDAGDPRDVSNNIDNGFDPYFFAIGQTDTVSPGALVPSGTVFTFEVDVDDPVIQQYLAEQLDLGRLHFMFATLHGAQEDESGNFPEYYTKENELVIAGFREAARLSLTVEFIDEPGIPGDLNGDGVVDGQDLLILLSQWGVCDDPNDCPADLNGDGVVDGVDLLILLSNWG